MLVIAAVFSFTTITSCKRKATDKTMRGVIYYKDSTSVPVANMDFSIHVFYIYGYPSRFSVTTFPFSTDANGTFIVKYKSPKNANIRLTYSGQTFNDSDFWSGASSKMGDDFNVGIIYAPKH